MTSKTSYFEPALFLRGLKKTFPVWLAYVVLWVLFLPLSILNRAQWDPKAADIRELILSSAIASVITTAVLALALAWVLFRFLFRTATSYDIAALPVRRESVLHESALRPRHRARHAPAHRAHHLRRKRADWSPEFRRVPAACGRSDAGLPRLFSALRCCSASSWAMPLPCRSSISC